MWDTELAADKIQDMWWVQIIQIVRIRKGRFVHHLHRKEQDICALT